MLCFSADKMQNKNGIAVKKSKSGTKFRDDLKRLIAQHACKDWKKKKVVVVGGTKRYFCLGGIALTSGSAAPPPARLLRVASAPTRGPAKAEALPPKPVGAVCRPAGPLANQSAAIGRLGCLWEPRVRGGGRCALRGGGHFRGWGALVAWGAGAVVTLLGHQQS